jgi:hypothetical protein
VYSLRWVDCEAKNCVNLWGIPVRRTAEAVGDVEVVDGEVLPPLLAPCIANFVDLFTPDAHKRPVVAPDRELLHAEQVVPSLLKRVLHCQGLQLNDGVALLGWVETARSAHH